MKNIEIKSFKALIPLDEYLKEHYIEEGTMVHYAGKNRIVYAVMPAFDTVILISDDKDVNTVKLHDGFGNCNDIAVVATCVLRSSLSSIVGVEQLNMFNNG